MKVLLVVMLCVAASLASEINMPIRVIVPAQDSPNQDYKKLECFLENTIKGLNPYQFSRKDNLCQNFPSILDQNTVDESISVEMTGLDNIEELRELSSRYGEQVVKLIWNVFGNQRPTAGHLNDVFDFLPKLEHVELRGWTNFVFENTGAAKLDELKTLTLLKGSLKTLQSFNPWLKFEKLETLYLDFTEDNISPSTLKQFINKQRSIKELSIKGYSDAINDAFTSLQLYSLSVDFGADTNIDKQKNFLKSIIGNNLNTLSSLILGDFLGHYDHVDDSVFEIITRARDLSYLNFGIDYISMGKIGKLSDLSSLTSLTVKSASSANGQKLYKVGLQRLPELQKLYFYAPKSSIEQRTFERISEYFPQLEDLTVYGTDVKINYFVETISNLQSLNVRYSSESSVKSLPDAFDEAPTFSNLNTLILTFDDRSTFTDSNIISGLFRSFRELTELEINSLFRFDPNYLKSLSQDIVGSVNKLKLGDFIMPCNERFGNREPEALKSLKEVFTDKLEISLLNEVEDRDMCYYMEFGRLYKKSVGPNDPKFSYDLLVRNLKDDFTLYYQDRDYGTKTKKLTIVTPNLGYSERR